MGDLHWMAYTTIGWYTPSLVFYLLHLSINNCKNVKQRTKKKQFKCSILPKYNNQYCCKVNNYITKIVPLLLLYHI